MAQPGIVGIFRIGSLDGFPFLGKIIVGLRNIHRAHMPDRLLGGAQHCGTFLHQLFRKLNRGRFELVRRNGIIDHADARGLLAVKGLPQARVIKCMARKHRVGDGLRDERARQNPPVHLRQAEGRILRSNRKVAGEQLHESSAHTITVHHGDGRLIVAIEPFPPPPIGGTGRLLAFARILFQLAKEFLQILSGAEISALAGDHHHLGIIVNFQARKSSIHVVMQLGRHGIALLRSIERRPCNSILHSHFYALVFVVGHGSSSASFCHIHSRAFLCDRCPRATDSYGWPV